VGSRAGLDWRKIPSPPGFDPGPSSPLSVAIPTELPGPRIILKRILNVSYTHWLRVGRVANNNFRFQTIPRILVGERRLDPRKGLLLQRDGYFVCHASMPTAKAMAI